MSYIDTRDLVERETEIEAEIEELEGELDSPDAPVNPAAAEADSPKAARLTELRSELDAIEELRTEVGSEFDHGETMIPTDEFEEYARELAKDIGAISGEEGWPLSHIDWEAAANELTADYIEVEWDGTDYYVRSS